MTDVADIEARAERLLASVPDYVWDGERLPVPVEDIADSCFGLLVLDVEDMGAAPGAPALAGGQALSGLLLPARREIWVNAEEARRWPPRRRFTIGHELGHWVMHRRGGRSLFCRHATVDEDAEPHPGAADIEEEASLFAAALLMPAELVRREYAQRKGDFAGLCATFGASGAAMGRRLHAVVPRA